MKVETNILFCVRIFQAKVNVKETSQVELV